MQIICPHSLMCKSRYMYPTILYHWAFICKNLRNGKITSEKILSIWSVFPWLYESHKIQGSVQYELQLNHTFNTKYLSKKKKKLCVCRYKHKHAKIYADLRSKILDSNLFFLSVHWAAFGWLTQPSAFRTTSHVFIYIQDVNWNKKDFELREWLPATHTIFLHYMYLENV